MAEKKHWMQDATAGMKKGALRRTLGVKAGHDIPAAKLEEAAHSENPTTRRRAALAKVFKAAHHNAGGCAFASAGQSLAHQHPEGHAHR
jgi:hypothetical protein